MRVWLRVLLAILGIGLATTAGAFVLGQYAPSGFSSYLAQSLSIAILSLGIASSTIAVLSGRGIEEYFKRRNEEKVVKSALVSYLAGLPLQISPQSSSFYGISVGEFPPVPKEYPREVDPIVQSQTNYLIQSPPVDTSYYEKNIKDRLLYLPSPLARQTVAIVLLVDQLNQYHKTLVERVSGESPIFGKEVFPQAYVISIYLNTHRKQHQLLSELGDDAQGYINKVTIDLLEGKEGIFNFQPLLEKLKAVKSVMDEANAEFNKTLFPPKKD